MDGFRHIDLASTAYGDLKFMLPVPRPEDFWGTLAPLRDTTWAKLIPVVSGDALSHALHGNPKPLMQIVGRPPRHQGKQLAEAERRCAVRNTCTLHDPHRCLVASGSLPECYVAPLADQHQAMLAALVAFAWNEGRYVFVVEGGEFVL